MPQLRLSFLIGDEAVDAAVAPSGVVPDQVETYPGPGLLVLAWQRATPVGTGSRRRIVATDARIHCLSSSSYGGD